MTPNQRAYQLLRWQALAPLADYDESIDYFSIQRQRSDIALDQWDKEHRASSSPELEAFRELERMGHYSQNDHFSPSKAAKGFYATKLKQIRQRTDSQKEGGYRQEPETPTKPYKHRRRAH